MDVIDLIDWSSEDEQSWKCGEESMLERIERSEGPTAPGKVQLTDRPIPRTKVQVEASLQSFQASPRIQPARAVKKGPKPEILSVKEPVEESKSIDDSLISRWKLIEDQLRCDVCKQLLDVPVSLKCYHTFCSFCIRRYLELSGNDFCPSCRISASSTDIRLEPRLAGILNILGSDRGSVRKCIRSKLKNSNSESSNVGSRNETFNKQADMAELFKGTSSGDNQVVGRTLLPLYKNLKDKQLKELILGDGLEALAEHFSMGRDDLIRYHKEFVFTQQAAYDAVRMGMYPDHPPTKSGLARAFNLDLRLKLGTLRIIGKTAIAKRRQEADCNETIADLTRQASARMANQLRDALLKRKRTN
jgi:hypothetical protein